MLGPTNPTTLIWDAPTTNADGTPLTDLAGYHVYISQAQTGPWTQVATVAAPAAQSLVSTWGPLTNGQYWATVRAYDLAGNASDMDAPVPFVSGDVVAPSPPVNLRFG